MNEGTKGLWQVIWNNEYATTWQRRFAWWPTMLDAGVSVWLCRYEQRYVPGPPPGAPESLHAIGYWERRPIQRPTTCLCPSMGHPEQCDEGPGCRWLQRLENLKPPNVGVTGAPR